MTTGRLAPVTVSADVRAGHRAPFALTPRSLALLGAGLVLLLPAVIDRRAWLVMIAWDLLVLTLVVLDVRRLPVPARLTVRRRWSGPLTLGEPTEVGVAIGNRGGVPITVEAIDDAGTAVASEAPRVECGVAAGGEACRTYTAVPRERGDAAIGAVVLRWRSGWALAERWGVAPVAQTVRVYPNLIEGRRETLYLVRSRQIALEKRRARRVGGGREFDSLRDYRDGDDRRDISWTAAARRGRLVTKVYQPERSQTVWILVDAGRLLRMRVGDGSLLDRTVTAALTLAQVALAAGDRVGLVAYGRRVQWRVAPSRGAAHLRALVDALALTSADGVEANHATAASTLLAAQKRRALVVWLTEVAETAGVPDVIEQALQMTPRHVVLFTVLRHPEIVALATASPDSEPAMYRVLAAQEALERRAALLHGLRRRGALVLEGSPRELSHGLVDRYLEVKERGLL